MGGSSRSGSGSAWAGHAELKEALDGLATAKGVSANRVKAVATAAYKYAKDYKRVVHDVEIFLWKSDIEHRLAGLYAMDAIMRQSQAKMGSKDVFVKRFSQHMSNTVAAVKKIPIDQQASVAHVIEEWQARGYYTADEIEHAGGHEYSLKNRVASEAARSEAPPAATPSVSPSHADPAAKAKIASLLSIIKKQKELQEQQGSGPPQDIQPARTEERPRGHDASRAHARDRSRSRSRSRGRDARRDDRDMHRPSRDDHDVDHRRLDDTDPRAVKRPRSSRWGPPRPGEGETAARDHNRPHAIDTFGNRDVDRSSRFESHSPRSRFQTPPSVGPPGPGLLGGPPPPFGGYQGPPPPFRSGPPLHPPPGKNIPPGPPSQFAPPGQFGPPGGSSQGGSGGSMPPYAQGPPPGVGGASDQPREVCRKFLAGRCTFGDRCWHIHDQSAGDAGRLPPRTEINNSRRKTVLCDNFPRGTCRYGDRCSFAHGEDDLDPSGRGRRQGGNAPSPHRQHQQPSPHGSAPAQPWAASPHSHSAPNAYDRPPVSGGPQFIPPYGASSATSQPPDQIEPKAVGGHAAPGVGGYNYPPAYGGRPPITSQPDFAQGPGTAVNQWAGAAAANGYTRGPGSSYPSAQPPPAQQASAEARARDRAPSRDEDEGTAPEFNLQYDDEDQLE